MGTNKYSETEEENAQESKSAPEMPTHPEPVLKSKERILDACCLLEDAIVVARITGYPDCQGILNTMEFLKSKGQVTNDEVTERQLKLLKEQGDVKN